MKKKIISGIEKTDNKDLLTDIYRLMELTKKTEEVFELNEEQTKSVKKGLRQITQKNTISHEKASKEIEKWLSK